MMNEMAMNHGNPGRRILLALACAAGLAAPMLAQEPATAPAPQQQAPQEHPGGGWQGREGHQLEHLTRALNLTPDQVSQIKTIQESARQQMIALHQDTTTPQADKRAKMMSLHQTEQTNIKAVLNDDQKSRFDAMQARMRERREDHDQGGPATQPLPPAA
jgi:Spy/CpxP family protein refolding chaperone